MVVRMSHTTLVPLKAVAADGVEIFDLPVNPLSVVLLRVSVLNETSTLSAYQRYMGLIDSLNAVRINYAGRSILNMRGVDIAALNYFRHGIVPMDSIGLDTDNIRRSVILPIFFGKFPMDPDECIPETRRGDLTMELDIDVADTGYDAFQYSVETVELIGAKPKRFERKVAINTTFGATGDADIPLPMASKYRGIFGFSGVGAIGSGAGPTLAKMRVLVDNQELGFQSTDFEVSRAIASLLGRQPFFSDAHTHRVNAASASATEPTTTAIAQGAGSGIDNYTFLDLDPTRDDMFSVDMSKANSSVLRVAVNTIGTSRIVPIEVVAV